MTLELFKFDQEIIGDFYQRYLHNVVGKQKSSNHKKLGAEDHMQLYNSYTSQKTTNYTNKVSSNIDWTRNITINFYQESDFLYYYSMERKGKHHGSCTKFTLHQVDI